MTFKDFMAGVFRLPARVLGGLVALVLGANVLNRSVSGLLGLLINGANAVLNGVKTIGRGITGLIMGHQKAIASAFWMSLLVGGAAALTVAFWPAALAAVVNFSVAGYSIASVVGTNFAAQVGATAGVGAVLTSGAVYSVASVANFFNYLASCCFPKKPTPEDSKPFVSVEAPVKRSATSLSKLSTSAPAAANDVSLGDAPVHTSSLNRQAKVENEPVVESTLSIQM